MLKLNSNNEFDAPEPSKINPPTEPRMQRLSDSARILLHVFQNQLHLFRDVLIKALFPRLSGFPT